MSLFSYEILGIVGKGGAGPHDIRRMVERGRLLAWAGESQYYSEPKRLARLGYLEAHKEPGKTRERTVYTLTDKGLEALREFAREPVRIIPLKSDALLRLLIADLVGEGPTRSSFATIREDVEELRARLDQASASAEGLPGRRKYLLMVIEFLSQFLDLHEELADKVERELGSRRPVKSARSG
jgi:DNA-binding PadR family transcriptional regulator